MVDLGRTSMGGGFNRPNFGPRRCFVCGATSHIARECPVGKVTEAANVGEDSSDELAFVCREEVVIEETGESGNVSDFTYDTNNDDFEFKLEHDWFELEKNGLVDSGNGNLKNPENYKGISIAKEIEDNGKTAKENDLDFVSNGEKNSNFEIGSYSNCHENDSVKKLGDEEKVDTTKTVNDLKLTLNTSDSLNYCVGLPNGKNFNFQLNILRTLDDITGMLRTGVGTKPYTIWNEGEDLTGTLTMTRWKPSVCLSGADFSVKEDADEGNYSIVVQFMTSEKIEVTMRAKETLFHLKEFVESIKKIPMNKQRFVWNRAVLTDDRTPLRNYGIKEGTVLYMVQNYRGGAKTVRSPKRNINPPVYADDTSAVTTYFDEAMNETCSRPLKKRKWATLPKDEPTSTDSDSSDDSSAFLTDEDDISHHSDFTDLTNNSVFVFYFAFQNPKNVSVCGCDNDVTGFFLQNRVGNNHVEMHYDRDFKEKNLLRHYHTCER